MPVACHIGLGPANGIPLRKGGMENGMLHARGTPLFLSGMPCSMPFSPNCSRNDLGHANGLPSGMSCLHAACKWNAKWHAIVHATRKWHATVQRWQPGVVQHANRIPRTNFTEGVSKKRFATSRGCAVLAASRRYAVIHRGVSARVALRHSTWRPRGLSPWGLSDHSGLGRATLDCK
jgi:hypothetical protein